MANPGEILLGKYRVEEIIGVGGMGRVVRASHLYLQQPVAIKILLPQMVESDSTRARFLREAQATVRLRSEHIARVMDVGTMPDGTPFPRLVTCLDRIEDAAWPGDRCSPSASSHGGCRGQPSD